MFEYFLVTLKWFMLEIRHKDEQKLNVFYRTQKKVLGWGFRNASNPSIFLLEKYALLKVPDIGQNGLHKILTILFYPEFRRI